MDYEMELRGGVDRKRGGGGGQGRTTMRLDLTPNTASLVRYGSPLK
jgi:hypothetical protein